MVMQPRDDLTVLRVPQANKLLIFYGKNFRAVYVSSRWSQLSTDILWLNTLLLLPMEPSEESLQRRIDSVSQKMQFVKLLRVYTSRFDIWWWMLKSVVQALSSQPFERSCFPLLMIYFFLTWNMIADHSSQKILFFNFEHLLLNNSVLRRHIILL